MNTSSALLFDDPPPDGWGQLVFRVELPLELALTGNEVASKKRIKGKNGNRFVMKRHNAAVDARIAMAKTQWPAWAMGVARWREPKLVRGQLTYAKSGEIRMRHMAEGGRRRGARVTRFSSVEPDEISCDVVGGKVPLDRLKHANVIRDDSPKWVERCARWFYAPPKQGRVVVEVFELEES